jgi:hypothetical protein
VPPCILGLSTFPRNMLYISSGQEVKATYFIQLSVPHPDYTAANPEDSSIHSHWCENVKRKKRCHMLKESFRHMSRVNEQHRILQVTSWDRLLVGHTPNSTEFTRSFDKFFHLDQWSSTFCTTGYAKTYYELCNIEEKIFRDKHCIIRARFRGSYRRPGYQKLWGGTKLKMNFNWL